jgi:hypothetical protein
VRWANEEIREGDTDLDEAQTHSGT